MERAAVTGTFLCPLGTLPGETHLGRELVTAVGRGEVCRHREGVPWWPERACALCPHGEDATGSFP